MKRKPKILLLSLATVLTFAVTACGGTNNSSTTAPATEVITTVPATETPSTEAPTTETPSTEAPTTESFTEQPTEIPTTEAVTEQPTEELSSEPSGPATVRVDEYDCISMEDAIALAGTSKDYVTAESYYIYGTVESIANPTYGNMTITDGNGHEFSIYGCYDSTGATRYDAMESKPVAGDLVVFYGQLTYYNMAEMKNAKIMYFYHETPTVDDSYTEASVNEARNAATGTNLKLTGVVAKITYANGMVPNGFFLVDDTGSIYVYGDQAAGQVKVGNTITVAGSKTYYIADSEASNAEKWGYKGCNQLQNPTILDNDNGTSDFDTSWISESTMKELMEKDPSEDFTTRIYKVNALVKKAPGSGFVNYYIDDLDGTTGSYCYTACNGSDYSWLDEYDGKLCTLYVTVINAKSTATGEAYRLVPIKILADDYAFDLTDVPEFTFDYYVKGQFATEYQANPSTELVTSVSNDVIPFENATVSYVSSNEEVAQIVTTEEKTTLELVGYGNADIEVTVTYGEHSYKETVSLSYSEPIAYEYVDVASAVSATVGDTVIVKGIVGPSLTNQVGFYLIDETGMIAVKTDSDTMANISMGDEVIMQGTRTMFPSDKVAEGTFAGQSVLLDSTLLLNRYGAHEYSRTTFDSTKTIAELSAFSVAEDHTTTGYIVNTVITKNVGAYATTYNLTDPDDSTKYLQIYASSGNQSAWLDSYVGKEVEVEIALVQWNKKNYYRACVLAVHDEAGNVYNTLNFSK